MKLTNLFLGFLIVSTIASCTNKNEEDSYPLLLNQFSNTKGLISHLAFSNSFKDEVDTTRIVQVHGNPVFSYNRSFTEKSAIIMDGKDDYMTLFIGFHDTIGISLWINNFKFPTTLFDYGTSNMQTTIDGWTGATVYKVYQSVKPDAFYTPTKALKYRTWQHLYVEAGGTENPPRVFIDGIEYKPANPLTRPYPMNSTSEVLYIGRSSTPDEFHQSYFNGMIDDIRIFNRRLSQEEINSLKNLAN